MICDFYYCGLNVMESSPLNQKLSHLNPLHLDELICRYYRGEKINLHLQEFEVNCSASQLPKLLPPLIDNSSHCPACGSPMMKMRVSRSSCLLGNEPIRCSRCQHADSDLCSCDFCETNRRNQYQKRQEKHRTLITEYCGICDLENAPDLTTTNISFTEAVALLAFVRTCGFRDGTDGHVLESFQNATIPFAPNGELGN